MPSSPSAQILPAACPPSSQKPKKRSQSSKHRLLSNTIPTRETLTDYPAIFNRSLRVDSRPPQRKAHSQTQDSLTGHNHGAFATPATRLPPGSTRVNELRNRQPLHSTPRQIAPPLRHLHSTSFTSKKNPKIPLSDSNPQKTCPPPAKPPIQNPLVMRISPRRAPPKGRNSQLPKLSRIPKTPKNSPKLPKISQKSSRASRVARFGLSSGCQDFKGRELGVH
ncbi:hypothetical protein M758_6G101400 [Ceratodon purpureus]|nr:hypothetical protein M758_6G101400 [Ceratodon purpureus]